MKPVEFVLWLNGAAELVGDQPPTPEQWATMRGKLGEAVGGLVAARLLERAEEAVRADERKNEAMKQRLESMMNQRAARVSSELAGYKAQMEIYKTHAALGAQRMRDLANDPSVGIISEVPETVEPPNPGFINRILGKVTT